MSPAARYQAEIDAGILIADALQQQVVQALDRLFQELSQPAGGWFSSPETPKGVYVYGSVGRGKTHLMDLFYDAVPSTIGKQRMHYHEFMLWLHAQLRAKGRKRDPLKYIIRDLAKGVRLLCLDEFLVNDITNAMLLSGLFVALEKYGIALVTTSNVRPDDLYHDGLQRAKFLPAIEWIQRHMQVCHLDGVRDYRYSDAQQNLRWFFPLNSSCDYHLQDVFEQLTGGTAVDKRSWSLSGRPLDVVKSQGAVLWCDFDALCRQPRAAADYIELCQQVDHLLLQQIPRMSGDDDNAARRFLTLIDIMYEQDTVLTASAEAHYEAIYSGEKLAFEFRRAVSRLNQLLSAGGVSGTVE